MSRSWEFVKVDRERKIEMIHKSLALGLCGAAVLLALAGCGGGGASSSSSVTLAQGSDPVVNGSGSSLSSPEASGISSEGGDVEELMMMTVDEAIAHFETLDPAALGLEGEDMSAYELYPTEKAVPVDGLPCLKITVYKETEAGTNEPVGTFLLARDGTAVYRLDDGQVTELDVG